nr:hypothetical protein [uncultured Acetatifactor sp.]
MEEGLSFPAASFSEISVESYLNHLYDFQLIAVFFYDVHQIPGLQPHGGGIVVGVDCYQAGGFRKSLSRNASTSSSPSFSMPKGVTNPGFRFMTAMEAGMSRPECAIS